MIRREKKRREREKSVCVVIGEVSGVEGEAGGAVQDVVVPVFCFALRHLLRAQDVKVKDCRVHRVTIFFRRALHTLHRFSFRFRVRIEVGDLLKGAVRGEPVGLCPTTTRSKAT